jgi:hypothetical protein
MGAIPFKDAADLFLRVLGEQPEAKAPSKVSKAAVELRVIRGGAKRSPSRSRRNVHQHADKRVAS